MTLLELLIWIVISVAVACWLGALVVYGLDGPYNRVRRFKRLHRWLKCHGRGWSFVACFAFGLPVIATLGAVIYLCYLAGQVRL